MSLPKTWLAYALNGKLWYHWRMQPRSIWREMFGVLFRAAVIVFTFIFLLGVLDAWYETESSVSDGQCNVAVLPLDGAILPFHGLEDYPLAITPQEVEAFFDQVESEDDIKGVLLEINSPGGTPVASERIAERIRASELPTVGLIGDMGTSGGYLVAVASDHVLASELSDVGGIGVTMSYVEESEKNEEEGLTFVELNSAEYKDAGNRNKPLTDAERELFEADLNLMHRSLVSTVAEYRGVPVSEIDQYADGASRTGIEALEANLIDSLGGRTEARERLAEQLSVEAVDISFCEYRQRWPWLAV